MLWKSISIDFPLFSQWDALLHHIAYDSSQADWDSLCDHLRHVPWEDILKLGASAATEFFEWVQVRIDVYIPHRKYQVNPHSSPWFSAACAVAIVHRNHFFCLYHEDDSKVVIVAKGLFNLQKRVHYFPEIWPWLLANS